MIVSRLRISADGGWARLAAEVVHEVAPAPLQSMFVEVPEQHAAWLHEVYDVFAVGCIVPATAHRETRLRIEGDLCPRLASGLRVAMAWHAHWYGPRWAPIALESGVRGSALPARGRAGAIYFSCGVDSLYSLRRVSSQVPRAHPSGPRIALFVVGYDLRKPSAIERALRNAREAADALELTLLPIRSNIPVLDDDYALWLAQFGGPAFAALPHALGRGIERAWFAADCDIPNVVPWSNHPATAPEYSSHDVEIRQDGIEATRAQKVAAIADWDVTRRFLRVCTRNPERELNCGLCEKCVRTRLELLAFAGGDAFPVFGGRKLTADDVRGIRIRIDSDFYDEVLPGLLAAGRRDLIAAIEGRHREWTRYKRWHSGGGVRGRVRRLLRLA